MDCGTNVGTRDGTDHIRSSLQQNRRACLHHFWRALIEKEMKAQRSQRTKKTRRWFQQHHSRCNQPPWYFGLCSFPAFWRCCRAVNKIKLIRFMHACMHAFLHFKSLLEIEFQFKFIDHFCSHLYQPLISLRIPPHLCVSMALRAYQAFCDLFWRDCENTAWKQQVAVFWKNTHFLIRISEFLK